MLTTLHPIRRIAKSTDLSFHDHSVIWVEGSAAPNDFLCSFRGRNIFPFYKNVKEREGKDYFLNSSTWEQNQMLSSLGSLTFSYILRNSYGMIFTFTSCSSSSLLYSPETFWKINMNSSSFVWRKEFAIKSLNYKEKPGKQTLEVKWYLQVM